MKNSRSRTLPPSLSWPIALAAILVALPATTARAQDATWAAKAPLPTPRYYSGAGVLNGRIYVVGGYSLSECAVVESYDPTSDSWTSNAPLPTARNGMGVAVANGTLYAIGGFSGSTPLATADAYDPATNTWREVAPMPTARGYLGIAVVNGVIYAIGGSTGELNDDVTGAVEAYDPSANIWTTKPALPTPRKLCATSVVGGLLYVVAGCAATGDVGTVEAFDATTGSWTVKPPLLTARDSHSTAAIGMRLYAFGGEQLVNFAYSGLLNSCEGYDDVSATWTEEPPLPTGRVGTCAAVVNGSAYVIGGWINGAQTILGTNEAFTPAAQPPTAIAGLDQSITVGQTVALDGSRSFAADTPSAELLYAWTFRARPNGSQALLSGATTPSPTFTADVPGSFSVELVVTDPRTSLSSAPATVTIASTYIAPTANAGNAQSGVVGQTIALDGSASNDPDGFALAYAWSIVSRPAGSVAVLAGCNTSTPSLVPDVPGAYTVALVVSDAFGSSAPATVVVSAISASDYAQRRISDALNAVAAMPSSEFDAPGHRQAFSNFLQQAIAALQAGDTAGAKQKLAAAMTRTDGVPLRGTVDGAGVGRDWIIDAAAQNLVYPKLDDAWVVLP